MQKLAVSDASAAYAWKTVGGVVDHPDTPKAIKDAYAKAQNSYFSGDFAKLKASVVDKMKAGEKPPMSIDDWRGPVTSNLATIADIASLAMDILDQTAKSAKAVAFQGLLGLSALFVLVLTGGIAGMVMIVSKVVRPIGALTHCMRDLADGDLKVIVPGVSRRDEIGEMSRSVEVFREAAIRNRALESEAEENRLAAERERAEVQARAEAEADERLRQATGALASGLRRLASATCCVN